MKGEAFSMQVTHIVHHTGRATVFTGTVLSGRVATGHRILVRSPLHNVSVIVAGIDIARSIRNEAKQGDKVSILVREFHPRHFSDGLRKREDGSYRVLSLTLTQPPRAWWQFWLPRA
jgi:translation elongation factor EF-Tu-like GTPase